MDCLQQQRFGVCACVLFRCARARESMNVFLSALMDVRAPSGYYTHISTLADVQENVMEYLHVLSRPMVINHDHDIIWTEAYMDTVVRPQPRQSMLRSSSASAISFVVNCFAPFYHHHRCLHHHHHRGLHPSASPLQSRLLILHHLEASQHQGGIRRRKNVLSH